MRDPEPRLSDERLAQRP